MDMENGDSREILELVNQRLEGAIQQLRRANEALQASHQELHSLSGQLEIMHQEADALREEIARLRAAALLDSAAS